MKRMNRTTTCRSRVVSGALALPMAAQAKRRRRWRWQAPFPSGDIRARARDPDDGWEGNTPSCTRAFPGARARGFALRTGINSACTVMSAAVLVNHGSVATTADVNYMRILGSFDAGDLDSGMKGSTWSCNVVRGFWRISTAARWRDARSTMPAGQFPHHTPGKCVPLRRIRQGNSLASRARVYDSTAFPIRTSTHMPSWAGWRLGATTAGGSAACNGDSATPATYSGPFNFGLKILRYDNSQTSGSGDGQHARHRWRQTDG